MLCPHQHCNNKKASKRNRMALNNGRKPQSKTAVNWLSNGLDEHYTEENDAIFSEIQVFVCCYEVGFLLHRSSIFLLKDNRNRLVFFSNSFI